MSEICEGCGSSNGLCLESRLRLGEACCFGCSHDSEVGEAMSEAERSEAAVYRKALASIAAPKQGVTAGEMASCMLCGHVKPFVVSEITQRHGVCRDCVAAAERGRAVPALENWADRLEAAVDPNHARAGFAAVIREMRDWSEGLGSARSHTVQPMADHRP